MENSNEYIRLNAVEEKMAGFLQTLLQLRADNDQLKQENASLRDETARLKEQMGQLEDSSTQYLVERDNIKNRVDRLISMMEEAGGNF
jgi:FtsZ-binding cell division protein ZapB